MTGESSPWSKAPVRLGSCCCLVVKLYPILCDPMDGSQALLSMGFPRQEYWSGLPFPSPGVLPHPGIELESPALAGRFFTAELPEKPKLGSYPYAETGR